VNLVCKAAHLAAEWQRVGHLPEGRSSDSLSHLSASSPKNLQTPSDGRSPRGGGASSSQRRLVVLLMLLNTSWCFVHLALETVVPLWMFSNPARGGLGFEPVDAALVFGFVGCVLLMLKVRHTDVCFLLAASHCVPLSSALVFYPSPLESPSPPRTSSSPTRRCRDPYRPFPLRIVGPCCRAT
jgi:hypothetical protein